ncbi:DNA-3-methyladenine glycosylase I [Botrimarina mediterranea]|nr:DNA-3-methyladenine glycosylase I [Botrimarina mediterranea]
MPTMRCPWAEGSDAERDYHDAEWGVPLRDDNRLFEMITLEGAQAGLSWRTVLLKREGYRRAFADFEPGVVARYTPKRVEKLLLDASIIRHRGKIESTISNARALLTLQEAGETLSGLVWSFVDDKPVVNRWKQMGDIPSETTASKAMSKELKSRGFRFVGPTTCYAFMQAAGLVNDHLVSCFRMKQVDGEQ